ncbi:MAG: hypothetical protein J7513_04540 [Solirubrobacteraceae bacterium]|nr:hypothetical protein [Solirubrobacteraceae bacterium]
MPVVVSGGRGERGQATVEFVALLPILALVALAVGQAAVAGWTVWSASGAARVAARAQALGQDPAVAVRRVLPAMLERHARVSVGASAAGEGRTSVRLGVPSVVPGLRFGTVRGAAELPDQAGVR